MEKIINKIGKSIYFIFNNEDKKIYLLLVLMLIIDIIFAIIISYNYNVPIKYKIIGSP